MAKYGINGLIASLALLWACTGLAGDSAIEGLLQQARDKELAHSKHWLWLLHYRSLDKPDSTNQSEIISPAFFLAPEGASNPEAELIASLRAFVAPPGDQPDEHAQCRFIARYEWLRQQLDWSRTPPPQIACPRFLAWSRQGQINRASLVFATGNLGEPAAFFGHLSLHFYRAEDAQAQTLMQSSINYGAIDHDKDPVLISIVKGIGGAYPGRFSQTRSYLMHEKYGEREQRDLWEYPLNLSPEQLRQLLTHSWEMLRIRFDYYFFKRNCTYHMARMIGPLIDQDLDHASLWFPPLDLFNTLSHRQNGALPLAGTPIYHPSRRQRFYAKYAALSASGRDYVTAFVQAEPGNWPTDVTLSNREHAQALDCLLDYYGFRQRSEEDNALQVAQTEVLRRRLALPVVSGAWGQARALPPTQGQKPRLVQLSAVQHDSGIKAAENPSGLELRLRPLYYDHLALAPGRPEFAQLTLLDLRLSHREDRTRLRALELVRLENLKVSRTGLPGDGGLAWRLGFGFEQQNLACDTCTVFATETGLGKSLGLGRHSAVYGMALLRLQTDTTLSAAETGDTAVSAPATFASGHIATSPELGLISRPFEAWTLRLTSQYRHSLDGDLLDTPVYLLENRFGSHRDWDIRLSYERHVAEELKASVSLYW